jgi:hypothetical protein
LVFLKKNANFFAKNGQQSQKILIITSTADVFISVSFFGRLCLMYVPR